MLILAQDTLILENLKDCCVDVKPLKSTKAEVWILPSLEALKFNADGLSQGVSGPTGIGGVLRNSKGKV